MHIFITLSLSLSVIPDHRNQKHQPMMFLVAIAPTAVLITVLCVAICVVYNIRKQDRTMYVTHCRCFSHCAVVECAIQLAICHGKEHCTNSL